MADRHQCGLGRPLEVEQEVEHLVGGVGIELAGRFVGEDHLGIVRERTRDGDALFLPARQRRRVLPTQVIDIEFGEELREPLFVTIAGVFLGKRDVLPGGEIADQIELLKDEADRLAT